MKSAVRLHEKRCPEEDGAILLVTELAPSLEKEDGDDENTRFHPSSRYIGPPVKLRVELL